MINIIDMWRILGRGTTDDGLMGGTIIKPKPGLQPQPFGGAYHASWQNGDFPKRTRRRTAALLPGDAGPS